MIQEVVERQPVLTISREELQAKLARDDRFKLVMTLNEWAFRAKHIPTSLHFNNSAEMLAALKKDDEIVVYCSNVSCLGSVAAYYHLVDHGYQHVRRFAGGLIEWEEAGLPLEGEWAAGAKAPPA
ncbi:MAG TPA: rhodanese-like domain-containing protein [Polyangia bacterium]|jgi:rhodanese-related sulfurtransferase